MIKEKAMNRLILSILKKRGFKAMRELDANSKNAKEVSQKLLLDLMQKNKDTEYGRKYDFASIHSIKDYKEKVPFSVYDDYAPYIDRMVKHNETNLISSSKALHYAISSGSVGVPKHIPVSRATLDCYNKYSANMIFGCMDWYYRKKFNETYYYGRGLNTLEARDMMTPGGVRKGPISATSLRTNMKLLKYIFSSPVPIIFTKEYMDLKYLQIRYALEAEDLTFMVSAFMTALVDLMSYMKSNWEELTDDIEKGVLKKDAKIPDDVRAELEKDLKPNRERAEFLRKEFKKGFDTPIIPRIWPHMSWIYAIGTGGFANYTQKMRYFSGDLPIHFCVYGASESLMAVARYPERGEFVLIPDSGFYEFIPVDSDDEVTTYTLDQLEVGRDYEIVVTNLSGFYRYKIKDVVRVTGYHHQSPKLKFVYRKNQMISIAGEKTNDESVAWAVQQFAKKTGTQISDYSIYADTDCEPGRYVVFMEPDHIMPSAKYEEYRELIERKLGEANPSFGTKVKTGILGKTDLHFEQQETYALYRDMMIMKGVSGNQLKPVRVIDTPVKEKFFFALIEKEG